MKYIIDVPEDMVKDGFVVKCEQAFCGNNRRVVANLFLEEYEEPDHSVVEDEVWELARLISLRVDDGGLKLSELYSCFGVSSIQDVMKTYSYQEAKAKYEAWKKENDEIRVGDVIRHRKNHYANAIVTYINDDKIYFVYGSGDFGFCHDAEKYWEKTGHHFDEVAELLNKIKED